MNLLNQLSNTDIYVWFSMVILCAVFFLANGIMIMVTKNIKLVSKKNNIKDIKEFSIRYGLVEVLFSSTMIIVSVIGMIFKNNYWSLFVIDMLALLIMMIVTFLIQKNYSTK